MLLIDEFATKVQQEKAPVEVEDFKVMRLEGGFGLVLASENKTDDLVNKTCYFHGELDGWKHLFVWLPPFKNGRFVPLDRLRKEKN